MFWILKKEIWIKAAYNIKNGTLIYSFEKKIPIQLILSKNKESVANEKIRECNYGVNVITYYSEILDPTHFDNQQKWIDHVKSIWTTKLNELYSLYDCKDEVKKYIKSKKIIKNIHQTHNTFELNISNQTRKIIIFLLLILIFSFFYYTSFYHKFIQFINLIIGPSI